MIIIATHVQLQVKRSTCIIGILRSMYIFIYIYIYNAWFAGDFEARVKMMTLNGSGHPCGTRRVVYRGTAFLPEY